ncbi:MAG: hypothetical protein JWP37_951 [Mucilaginibacter sp.]|nr:hypothetical protein [Mucilaginibacter sp.]
MKKHYRNENDCLNCGTILEGKFCYNCGQENLELKENFGHMMSHAISDYFHFDHLFFHTLKPLLFKPGLLTNEYMAGRRAQYLHPVKMYIFISIVYFLLLFQSGNEVVNVKDTGTRPANVEKSLDSTKKAIAKNPYIPNAAKKEIEKDIDKSKAPTKKGHAKVIDSDAVQERGPNKWFHPITKDSTYKLYTANQNKLPADERDNFVERLWNKKTFSYREKYGPGAKDAFLDELKHNTPKMMFLLLPLLALILRFAFWKNRKYYVEHMIYAFHFHCFLFLFLGMIMLLQIIIPESWGINGWLKAIATFYIIWYVYRSLRVVYQRSRFRTITKIMGMSFMYFFAFTFCLCLLFFVTAII